ncbi:MAG: nitroreductase family protein [Phocaeicola sp.]|uniref:nitroreductase family protein n=1 Tax=Phocaeicola sp. TaxID=2773926 RepID=UPI0023C67E8A|nr:nitroreductase family protein [Phocaeicola sp.]MDE5678320.1 nitroreductase family protein [Phocaeicola sp.]MDE6180214.1 nitroreductase family protein [Phocaeicola sp.]
MAKSFKEALKARRTYYRIDNKSTLSNAEIKDLLNVVVEFVPSAFNSQTTRVVLLTNRAHKKLWNIVKETLRKQIPADVFGKTEEKIDGSFACGYGTILFFEDMSIIRSLQEHFPVYQENFPIWAEQTDAMHQLAVWTLLEDVGMGASVQHYNPLIDEEVRAAWHLPADWKLVAQMPFGTPLARPGIKEVMPLDKRVFEFTD